MKKLLASTGLIVSSWLAASPALAIDWLYIGNRSGYNYYVDVARDNVKGSYWSSPVKATRASDRKDFYGELSINCSDYTYRVEIEKKYYSNWSRILSGTPADYVADRVCQ